MSRMGTAAVLSAALCVVQFAGPAEGIQRAPYAPPVKGVVLARSDHVLVVDQIVRLSPGQSRTVHVRISPRTRVGGRRAEAGGIRRGDLIRAEGVPAPDGSLEALHVEVIITAGELERDRRARGRFSGVFWDWILKGSLSIPLP